MGEFIKEINEAMGTRQYEVGFIIGGVVFFVMNLIYSITSYIEERAFLVSTIRYKIHDQNSEKSKIKIKSLIKGRKEKKTE